MKLAEREFSDTSTEGETAITRTTLRLTGQQAFTQKIAADVVGRYVLDAFVNSPTGRQDITLTFEGGVKYQLFRWFGLGLRYEYEKKDSDVNTNDYSLNRVILSFTAKL